MAIDIPSKVNDNEAASKKRRKDDKEKYILNIRALLECPVCSNVMYSPIHQCINGHTLCSSCKPRVHDKCPTCRHELGNIRCLILEKAASSIILPCKYQCNGCVCTCSYDCKLKHESECEYRPYSCPYPGSKCGAAGNVTYLVKHLEQVHKVGILNSSSIRYRYFPMNQSGEWVPIFYSCLGQYFCLHFEALQFGKEPFYMAFLRFMGNSSEAKKYTYTLEVKGCGHEVKWQGVPRSIRDGHTTVHNSYEGLLIKQNIALLLSDNELSLDVHGRIWEEK